MRPQDPDVALWFAENLLPHEAMLRAWLRAQYPSCSDIDDVVQEAFVRVLDARNHETIQSPKAFLFATARNVVLMQLRHRQVERINSLTEIEFASVLDDGADLRNEVSRSQELELLTDAIQSLPTRCRQIITLKKIYGMSQKEVAAELGISEHTVEAQGTLGLHKIAKFLRKFDLKRPPL